MNTFLAFLLLAFSLFLTVSFLWFAFDHFLNALPGRIAYVPTNRKECLPHLEKIISTAISNPEQYIWIEPGGGVAHVTRSLARRFSWRERIVIDRGFTYLLLARLSDLFAGIKGTRYHWRSVYGYPYPKPACMYCYLSSPILHRLHKEGAFSNALVITLTFPIPGVKPSHTIPLTNWQEQLLVYDFRSKGKS